MRNASFSLSAFQYERIAKIYAKHCFVFNYLGFFCFVHSQNKCATRGRYEDVEVGKCLHSVGVASHNSRDRFGRDTFHPLRPSIHISGPIPTNQIPQDRFTMVAVSIHVAGPPLQGRCSRTKRWSHAQTTSNSSRTVSFDSASFFVLITSIPKTRCLCQPKVGRSHF